MFYCFFILVTKVTQKSTKKKFHIKITIKTRFLMLLRDFNGFKPSPDNTGNFSKNHVNFDFVVFGSIILRYTNIHFYIYIDVPVNQFKCPTVTNFVANGYQCPVDFIKNYYLSTFCVTFLFYQKTLNIFIIIMNNNCKIYVKLVFPKYL